MAAMEDPLGTGIQAGIVRAQSHGMEFDQASLYESVPHLTDGFLASVAAESNPRFVELFTELVTVAVIARSSYEEAPLEERQVEEYFHQSAAFLNSFRHV
jgi:hypothetical protein